MRIIQSFCSFGSDLLKHNFGWLSPQHHVMAWTMSCLNLKQFYDDIHFYTDSNTKKVLIDYLELPYTHVHTCFDKIDTAPNLWALPKLMTYSYQTTPFIHIDGDVFIWENFSSRLEAADLIAQNLEKGTDYYRSMMEQVVQELAVLPEPLKKTWEEEAISAVNAGIFGGSDLKFIEYYTNTAFDFIKANKDVAGNLSVFMNILFEQVLFHTLAKAHNKKVTCYFNETFNDNGYTSNIFSDFSSVPFERKYLHLIGQKKMEKSACGFIESLLLKQYPEHYAKIIHLFKNSHFFYSERKSILKSKDTSAIQYVDSDDTKKQFFYRRSQATVRKESCDLTISTIEDIEQFLATHNCDHIEKIFKYEQELYLLVEAWKHVAAQDLYPLELSSTDYFEFFFVDISRQENYVLKKNPYLTPIEESFEWNEDMFAIMSDYQHIETDKDLAGIVCVPELFFTGCREVVIDTLAYNILVLLENPISVKDLTSQIQECFSTADAGNYNLVYELVLMKLKFLFANKCIFVV